jgi:putative N6-adenine-specific DNA methylase
VTLPPQDLSCFAVVTPGLEPFAIAEAEALGLKVVAEPGGFAWQGSAESALVANVGLRIASRVLVRLASFEARSFAELERHARKIAWARVIAPGESVRFRVTCKKSKLYHSDAVAQRLADAVKRALPGVRAEGASIGEDETDDALEDAALIVVRVMRDRCTVSADSSGALLHRRGYRLASTKAPLRETIAAGMLAASGWDAALPLVDPLCGSGTIPIEAALVARGIAPGAQRTFAMERWPTVDASLREAVRDRQAGQVLQSGRATIAASDRDSGAIAASRENAQRAGVGDDIAFGIHALSAAVFPNAPLGWVVTNPPYGVRVGDADRVRDLWAQLGNVLRERASGWRLAVLSPDAALDRQLRIPMRAAAALSNGGIPVRIMVGEIP